MKQASFRSKRNWTSSSRTAAASPKAVIPSEDSVNLRLTTLHENGLGGADRELLEGRGFSPAAKPLTHHFVVPPLPQAGEGPGVRGSSAKAGLKPRPSATIFIAARNLALLWGGSGKEVSGRDSSLRSE